MAGNRNSTPSGTVIPQGTAIAPQSTAVAPQSIAVSGKSTSGPDSSAVGMGTEAVLIPQNDGRILKKYNPGYRCNASVLKLVKLMKGRGAVVDLYDFGTDDSGCDFEIMENCSGGSAAGRDLRKNADAILKIVVRTAANLGACHSVGFIHKDIKPANILFRDDSDDNCVLCDFGIADILEKGKVTTLQSRTPIYAAPEVYDTSNSVIIDGKTYCKLTPAADFYSLGMTALCLWFGEKNFLMKEAELAIEKVKGNIKVPKEIPDPLNRVIRGLLVKDPAHRWSDREVSRAVSGEKVAVYDGGLSIVFDSGRNLVAHSTEELAEFMLDNPKNGAEYLYSGKISSWLSKRPEIQVEIDRIVEKDFPRNQMLGYICALHILNPLYDLNLCCDPADPDYAMTGESIGRKLNEAYEIYWGKYNFEKDDMFKYWDREDAACFCNPNIVFEIICSFVSYSHTGYVEWFLEHKGNRFKDQISWMKYCLDYDSIDNRKKAGPKDDPYKYAVGMMKTIYGFGHTPEYNYPDSFGGLRGYLAVTYHENPFVDLSEKYTYEKLLVEYIDSFRELNADKHVVERFDNATSHAKHLAYLRTTEIPALKKKRTTLLIVGAVLCAIPAMLLVFGCHNIIFKILWAALFLGFLISFLFKKYTYAPKPGPEPGYDQLVVEPLYFAFNEETSFHSTLAARIDGSTANGIKSDISDIRKRIILFALIFWALFGLLKFMPERVPAAKDAENTTIVHQKRERGIIRDE